MAVRNFHALIDGVDDGADDKRNGERALQKWRRESSFEGFHDRHDGAGLELFCEEGYNQASRKPQSFPVGRFERVESVILYNLICAKSHAFEGWFRDSAAFDRQAKDGTLLCPVCNTNKVTKAVMAPAVSGAKKARLNDAESHKMRQFATGLRRYVEQNADYVGRRFPEEARRIHYGETEERHIYGEATAEEARELIEEGVDVAPLPPDIKSAN